MKHNTLMTAARKTTAVLTFGFFFAVLVGHLVPQLSVLVADGRTALLVTGAIVSFAAHAILLHTGVIESGEQQ